MNPLPTYTLDSYRFSYREQEVEALVERLHDDSRDGLRADLTITTSRHPSPGTLFSGRVSLSLPSQQQSVIKSLHLRCTNGFLKDVDWSALLLQVEVLSKRRWRDGDPAVLLAEQEPNLTNKWLLYPYLQEGAVTVLYGDGGVGKTTLANTIAIAVATKQRLLGWQPARAVNVEYLDWETEMATHWELVRALCNSMNIPIPRNLWYRRMSSSLPAGIGAVRKDVAINDIGLIILDSMGLAGGDEPERAGPKIAIFNALRSLTGCTVLAIDHVSKTDKGKPYGSVYTRNIARVAWEVTRADEDIGDDLNIALRLEKLNRGKAPPRQGYTLRFHSENDVLTTLMVEKKDALDFATVRAKIPLATLIVHELEHGAMTVSNLVSELSNEERAPKEDSIRKALQRGNSVFQPLQDGYWGLKLRDQ